MKRLKNIPTQLLLLIATLLSACTNEEPIPNFESSTKDSVLTSKNRTPEEAISIAIDAYGKFYGDEAPASRRAASVAVYQPVEIIGRPSSRSNAQQDTLLYVVNFADDKGFAIISAPRWCEEVLAVTSNGNYSAEKAAEIPAFNDWLEMATVYASLTDTVRVAKRDSLVIIDGPIINPPKIDPPKDSLDIRLQQKEWNDTTFKSLVKPQIRNSWGQGFPNYWDYSMYPEGFLMSNGLCGCGPLAVAEACLFYKYPASIQRIRRNGKVETIDLDWELMSRHKKWPNTNNEHNPADLCFVYESSVHTMIAELCSYIAEIAKATPKENGTATTSDNIRYALCQMLRTKTVSNSWNTYTVDAQPVTGRLMLIIGTDKTTGEGHAWISDGSRRIEYDHYFATATASSNLWEIKSKTHVIERYNHFNWGWYGNYNGWFSNSVVFYNNRTQQNVIYQNMKYIYIQ